MPPFRRPQPHNLPSRRRIERFERDNRFKQSPNFIERISFMADPKEWLIPTTNPKPREIADVVDEMRQKGWVQMGVDKNGRLKVTPTPLARGLHLLTRYCLHPKPFVRLPSTTQIELINVYIVTLIRKHDYNPLTKKYNSDKPLSLHSILARVTMDGDQTTINRSFRAFGNPKDWDDLTRKYYHFLSQKEAIAQATDKYLTQKRWKSFMELRAAHKLQSLLPKSPFGRRDEL